MQRGDRWRLLSCLILEVIFATLVHDLSSSLLLLDARNMLLPRKTFFSCISKDEECSWPVILSQLMGSGFPHLPTSASSTCLIIFQSPSPPATALTGCGPLPCLLKERASFESGRKWVTSPGGLTLLPIRSYSRFNINYFYISPCKMSQVLPSVFSLLEAPSVQIHPLAGAKAGSWQFGEAIYEAELSLCP